MLIKALIKRSKGWEVLREEGSVAVKPSIQKALKVAFELLA
jgi:hypothetical protein